MTVGTAISVSDGNLMVSGNCILSDVCDNILISPNTSDGSVNGAFIGVKSVHCRRCYSGGQSAVYNIFLPILKGAFRAVLLGNINNELDIYLESVWREDFLSSEDFEPALIPEKTIPDPDDKKPKDWDVRAKILDPEASKPDDWDEDGPMEIEDAEVEKPEGWLDDEPEEIDDPEASKPEDWYDEEDGAWEPPMVDNPKCEATPGCAIGIEIWTIQDGILFDNILIAADEKVAESYRDTTWKPKFKVDKEKHKSEDEAAGISDWLAGFQKKFFDLLYKVADVPFLAAYKLQILDVIEKGEKQPNITIGVLVSFAVVILSIIYKIIFGGKKPIVVTEESKSTSKPSDTTDQGTSRAKEEETDGAAAAPRRRNTRSENKREAKL
ncbi:hypothetical protein GIB67_012023 [Kingdonia uniflora]|uniref:Uncharacterized protein n=1 Tax=Kingdonia uniflora TaxID=39325 RepID=A0A7J7M0D7_9MAGN|nr:hypothetical protein GIB67_012023 [Kingdonia uniflora]